MNEKEVSLAISSIEVGLKRGKWHRNPRKKDKVLTTGMFTELCEGDCYGFQKFNQIKLQQLSNMCASFLLFTVTVSSHS